MVQTRSSDLKNIVIIGASVAGANAAHALEVVVPDTHRIVLIEANDFVYWPIGGLRGAVEPGFEDTLFATLDGFFKMSDRHVALSGTRVTKINPDSVELEKPGPFGTPFEGLTKIPLDLGLIAAGSTYAIPMEPAARDIEEAAELLRRMQGEVAAAESFLIVGGGPVGIEFAGEVIERYPNKKVTLVEMTESLVGGYKNQVHKKLMSQMKAKGVDVRLNVNIELTDELKKQSQRLIPDGQKVDVKLSDGVTIQTDFLFIGAGGKPNTSFVPQELLESEESAQGPQRINVDEKTLRVRHPDYQQWFAAGDICNTRDSKTAISAADHAAAVALQMMALITQNERIAKPYKAKSKLIVVPFGKYGGASQLPFIVLGEWTTSFIKGRNLLGPTVFEPQYPGGLPLVAKKKQAAK